MNAEHIKLVQDSFRKVSPISDHAAALFYARLFELDPSLRPLFKTNLHEQGRKLMLMLATAVNSLGDLESLVPAVQSLGRRHAGYGVKDAHYDTVGEALLWTLRQGLGEDFQPPVREAWTQAYTLLASAMKEAAKERTPI